MQEKHISVFVPDLSWKEHHGALFVVAHPDDEVLIGWGVIQAFVEAGIPVTVLLMTLGEGGTIAGTPLPPGETATIRRQEFESATHELGVRGIISDPLFPDSDLRSHQESLNKVITQTVRQGEYDVIVSFTPGEYTYRFDHRDHHAVSQAALAASETADMPTVYPSSTTPPLSYRPAFLGWTTNPDIGAAHQIRQVPLAEASRSQRTEFLARHYASQFPERSRKYWEPIFDRITQGEPNEAYRQLLFRIR